MSSVIDSVYSLADRFNVRKYGLPVLLIGAAAYFYPDEVKDAGQHAVDVVHGVREDMHKARNANFFNPTQTVICKNIDGHASAPIKATFENVAVGYACAISDHKPMCHIAPEKGPEAYKNTVISIVEHLDAAKILRLKAAWDPNDTISSQNLEASLDTAKRLVAGQDNNSAVSDVPLEDKAFILQNGKTIIGLAMILSEELRKHAGFYCVRPPEDHARWMSIHHK